MAEALSITEATGLLDAAIIPPEEDQTPEVQADAVEPEEIEAQPSADDADAPDEASKGDEAVEAEEAQPSLTKPRSWAADADEVWNGIPHEAQEIILARETERDAATDRALQQAAAARREAEEHTQSVTQIQATLAQVLPQAQRVFQSKWNNWTPQYQAELARANPAEFTALKAQFDAEQSELSRFQGLQQEAERVAYQSFVQTEGDKLTKLSPDLADPKEGPARKTALATFLAETGVPVDQIGRLDANAIAIAYDAMRWRQAQGRIAQTKPPVQAKPALKPAAASAVRTPQREAQEVKNRFAQTRSVEDAVRLLGTRG